MEEVSAGLLKATMELRRLGIFKSINITCGQSAFTKAERQRQEAETGRTSDTNNTFIGGVLDLGEAEEYVDVVYTDVTIEVVEKGLLGVHAGTYMQGEAMYLFSIL